MITTFNDILLSDSWNYVRLQRDDGPKMTMAGTVVKFFILLVLFGAGFGFSWHHFYTQHLHETSEQILNTTLNEMPAWQGYWLYTELRYPLFAWLLFLITFVGCFFTKKGLVVMAPVCVTVQGVSLGAFEYVLQNRYPGITLFCATLVVGLFVGVLLAYWLVSSQTDNVFAIYAVGIGGGLLCTYLMAAWIKSLAIPVPFIHQMPAHWSGSALVILFFGSGVLVNTMVNIQKAIDAEVPKWAEWRGAVSLFASFFILLNMLRSSLLRRSVGKLVFDKLMEATPSRR